MLTLIKSYSADNKLQKRINVKKIISLKDVIDKPIKNITFKFNNIEDCKKIESLSSLKGETEVKILVVRENDMLTFELRDKRKIDNRLLNSLNLVENVLTE